MRAVMGLVVLGVMGAACGTKDRDDRVRSAQQQRRSPGSAQAARAAAAALLPPAGTCAGACGAQSSNGACWCDEVCTFLGDCCADKEALCPVQPPTGTCAGACGTIAADSTCWCDEACATFGDCCSDKQALCPSGTPCGPQTCGAGEVCCNESCGICTPQGGDCTQQECAPASCQGACGGAAPDGSCYCDEACTVYGDCCADVTQFCAADGGVVAIDGGAGGVSCGSFSDAACGPDEFCNYTLQAFCGFADSPGFCAPRPQACVMLVSQNPVCGCDFVMYPSECEANVNGVAVLSVGSCP